MSRVMTPAQLEYQLKKWGVNYKKVAGWKTRGRPKSLGYGNMHGGVQHHTGSDSQTLAYIKWLFTIGRGSEGIPAPLAQFMTMRNGTLWVGAIGRANHAGSGDPAVLNHVLQEDYDGYRHELRPRRTGVDGNAIFYGDEAAYSGSHPMSAKQYDTCVRLWAAICDFHGWSALSIIGHREWSTSKWDPGHCPMDDMRRDIQKLLDAGPGNQPTKEEDDMPTPKEFWNADLIPSPTGSKTNKFWRVSSAISTLVASAYRQEKALTGIEKSLAELVKLQKEGK